MTPQDWVTKDFYKALGVKKDASAADIRSRTANSRAIFTPTRTPTTRRPKNASRRSRRPTRSSVTRTSARNTTKRAPCSLTAVDSVSPGPAVAVVGATSATCSAAATSATCSAGCSTGAAGAGRRQWWPRSRRAPRPTGRGHRVRGVPVVRRRAQRRDDPLRLTGDAPARCVTGRAPSPARCRASARPAKARVTSRATPVASRSPSHAGVSRPRAGRRRPLHHLSWVGTGYQHPDRADPHPGGVRTASASGWPAGRPARTGPAGDLYVIVHVLSHAAFGRAGDNVTVTVPITFTEAALGAGESAGSRGKTVTLKIPAGTANGRTFRVRGRGVRRRDGTTGDLLASVEVVVPQNLTDEERAALQSYADTAGPSDPRVDLMKAAGAS